MFTNVKDFINWVEKQRRFSKKTNLDKMRFYCSLFDNPQDKFKSIHVTGTNGKGSTVAFIASVLKQANLNVATFTSPYITYFNERIQYNGKFISDDELLKYANQVLSKYDEISNNGYELPSFFEFITLVAFLYFSEIKDLDFAIIEVGIGGRIDSTNVINSEIAVLSNVAFDHMNVLGDTLEKIATEKLGIVKNHEPLVIGTTDLNLQKFIKSYANENQIPLTIAPLRACEIKKMTIYGSELLLEGFSEPLWISLVGKHQVENAMTAISTIEVLGELHPDLKAELLKAIPDGVKNTKWPGRLEIVNSSPLILIDGAHNIDGITRTCEFIRSLPYRSKRAIVSISKDKEKMDMIKIIDQTFDEVIFTKYSYDRSATPEELYELSTCQSKLIIPTIDETITYVKTSPVDFTIFLGSLYLVCDIKRNLK